MHLSKSLEIVTLATVLSFLIQGCALFKPERDNGFAEKLPQKFSFSGKGERKEYWWKEFNSPELNSLIEQAFAGNLTLKEAWQRVRQAEAVSIKSSSALKPAFDLDAGGSRNRKLENVTTEENGKKIISRKETISKNYSLGLAASYELDLWGRVRATRNASALLTEASYADLESAAVTIAGSITENWLNLCAQRAKLILLKEQIELDKQQLELIELRQRNSLASALDVYQQKQVLTQAQAQIPLTEIEEQSALHRIAILLGKLPREELNIKSVKLPEYKPIPETGVMADIIEYRPDLKAVRLRIESADWNVAAAKADRLPAIRLTGSSAYTTDSTGSFPTLFENWYLNLAAGLTAPIFDGGRKKAEAERLKAAADALLLSYRSKVLGAVKEVEDAILRERKQLDYLNARTEQADFARLSYNEAKERYLRGMNDYLPVLQALESLQKLEREIIEIRAGLHAQRVGLYRALGSSWTEEVIKRKIAEIKEVE